MCDSFKKNRPFNIKAICNMVGKTKKEKFGFTRSEECEERKRGAPGGWKLRRIFRIRFPP